MGCMRTSPSLMGKVTYEELQQIKERFMELDLDASGVVEFDELSASGGAGKNLDGDKIDPKAMKTALQYCNSQEGLSGEILGWPRPVSYTHLTLPTTPYV